jgi:predicted dehydrogenase
MLGVGVIGASLRHGWARRTHLPALAGLDGYRLAAVATTRQETADEAAAAFGVPHAFSRADELVAHPDVDVVVVCVRVPLHLALVRAAVDAGKHVFCEWPLALSAADARSLLAAASAAGVRHAVGLQARSSPVVRYLRDLVADGYLGRVLSATVYSPTLSGGPTTWPAPTPQTPPTAPARSPSTPGTRSTRCAGASVS